MPADQPNSAKSPSVPIEGAAEKVVAAAALPGAVPPSQLTPEEQMALFEKDLKENDWGHQPC